MAGEGQYATTGGTVSFMNDYAEVANRLPRPVTEGGAIWIKSPKTTESQVMRETSIRPDTLISLLRDVKAENHPAYDGIDLARDDELETLYAFGREIGRAHV